MVAPTFRKDCTQMSVNIILPENFDEIYHEINTLITDKKRRCKSQKDSIA